MCSISYLTHYINRKLNGKADYQAGVIDQKSLPFPYPGDSLLNSVASSSGDDGGSGQDRTDSISAVSRPEFDYQRQIADLQARLHSATAQVEQKNGELVKVENENSRLNSDLKEQSKTLNKFRNENLRLARQIESEDEDGSPERPRPGAPFKAWENLTPRNMRRVSDPIQEVLLKTSEKRQVDPVKLSAEILYR